MSIHVWKILFHEKMHFTAVTKIAAKSAIQGKEIFVSNFCPPLKKILEMSILFAKHK
jgi:hypothetical protein